METLRKLLVVFIGFPIGITLALTIGISVTLIWPIYILCLFLELLHEKPLFLYMSLEILAYLPP